MHELRFRLLGGFLLLALQGSSALGTCIRTSYLLLHFGVQLKNSANFLSFLLKCAKVGLPLAVIMAILPTIEAPKVPLHLCGAIVERRQTSPRNMLALHVQGLRSSHAPPVQTLNPYCCFAERTHTELRPECSLSQAHTYVHSEIIDRTLAPLNLL
jgi:hypothetical protein